MLAVEDLQIATPDGTADILYNDNVLMKLNTMWTLNVRLVPNTWRELSTSS